ncbi:MAG: AAA family ATPase [Alphaproteobacteria bacterium]|nr:AAA family ATPase [Alphaproteobacteria bacterium]
MAIVVSLLNQKGGVGKTSSCHHLAGTLAAQGRRVLLLDNDPQASLTQGIFGPGAMRSFGPSESMAALYDPDRAPIPEAVIRPTPIEGVSLVPGSVHLTRFNQMPPERWHESDGGMREFLADPDVADAFDLVLIDNPPNLHLCGWSALVASNGLVVPLQAEDYGAQGIVAVLEAVEAVRRHRNPDLATLGFLLTMYDKRLAIHVAYERQLRDLYGPLVFDAAFPLAKDFKEAVASRLPIARYKPRSAAAKATAAVAEELVRRASESARSTVDQAAERGAA